MKRHALVAPLSMTLLGALAAAPVVAGCGGGRCDPNAPHTICTIAGSGGTGYRPSDIGGPAIDAEFDTPTDTAIGPDGDVWISNYNNYLIQKIDKNGNLQNMVGTGNFGDDPEPPVTQSPALQTSFNHIPTFVFSPDHKYLWLAAWHDRRVKRLTLSTMMVENIAGTGKAGLYAGDGGPALKADIDLPSGIALDPRDGNPVVIDQTNEVIRKINMSTGNVDYVAGQCVIGWPCPDGKKPVKCPDICPNEPNTGGQYSPTNPNPADLPCAGETPSGKYTCGDPSTCDQLCAAGYAGDGGPATEMHMNQPQDQAAFPDGRLDFDNKGDLFFTDPGNNRIREITTDGIVHTVVGTGTAGYSGDGGPAAKAEVNHPYDVQVMDDGTIYFTDTLNNCIRKVTPPPSRIISTVAGQCNPNMNPYLDPKNVSAHFGGDGGDPKKATLNWPYGLDVVGNKLYISDTYNERIRVVNM